MWEGPTIKTPLILTDMKPYEIIYQQLGRKTFVMLGAKNIVHDGPNILRFDIRGSRSVNRIIIEYRPGKDLYDMAFMKIPGIKTILKWDNQGLSDKEQVAKMTVAFEEGIYFDMMRPLIEKHTGLYTRL